MGDQLPARKPHSLRRGAWPALSPSLSPILLCLALGESSPASPLLCFGLSSALEVSLTSREDQRLPPFLTFDNGLWFHFLIFFFF
jgi:hypothetical protein